MALREKFASSLKEAMEEGDTRKIATIRLIQTAVKDRDIASRAAGKDPISDDEIHLILTKMLQQRALSAAGYEEESRIDLAQQEQDEARVIRAFLPEQLSDEAVHTLCVSVVKETGASKLRDMGKCINVLKQRYPGKMDFSKASGHVKGLLR